MESSAWTAWFASPTGVSPEIILLIAVCREARETLVSARTCCGVPVTLAIIQPHHRLKMPPNRRRRFMILPFESNVVMRTPCGGR